MQETLDQLLIRDVLHQDPATWDLTWLVYAGALLAVGFGLTVFGAIVAGITSWWERRIAARMQSRIGPNRVGPQGALQFLADALKLILKEDLVPPQSDQMLFRIAPYFVMTGFALTFVVLPFGYHLSATSMNVGLFYLIAVTALVVVGILLSGWASNSKWSLFGGMRAAAQVVSYEIPGGMVALVPIIMAGSLNMHDIIRQQGGYPWDWFMFQSPWGFFAFFIFFVTQLAEGNRTPFDLPEAESELVAGYMTEYSGIRFGYYFLAEWGNVFVMSAVVTTLFLGGWQVPGVSAEALAAWEMASAVPIWFYALSLVVFLIKVLVLMNVVIWIRWTLPRVRVDQMMSICWKYLVPASLGLVLLAALTEVASFALFGEAAKGPAMLGSPRSLLHIAFFLVAGAVPAVMFALKTLRNIRITGDRIDLTNW
ncbi:MAG: NADH-quinone oxidoreductase subunit NuoH [Myxococcaceae bacterium]